MCKMHKVLNLCGKEFYTTYKLHKEAGFSHFSTVSYDLICSYIGLCCEAS